MTPTTLDPTDYLLFAVFPYAAVLFAVVGGFWRFKRDRFSFSSLSSQFLEDRQLFRGSVAWHFGIVAILLAHVIAFLFPGPWRRLLSNLWVLSALEVMGLSLALAAIVGLAMLIVRRVTHARVLATSSVMDWVLLTVVAVQVVTGFSVALFYRWGADWYMDTSVPWIMSLIHLRPRIEHVADLPVLVKFHMLLGFGVIALFPFTRLVHVVTVPVTYLWRPLQVVIWNRRRGAA